MTEQTADLRRRPGAVAVEGPRTSRRIAPALGLFFLAPLVGEYLLGNVPFEALHLMPFLAPMYGGGALLIREVARRSGRGWPTIILLACAYGVLEPGVLDQSLFNPSFEGWDFQRVAQVPALGISAYHAQAFIAGHAIWSISVPIAIVESLVHARRTTPWLGLPGLAVTGVVFVLGSALIFSYLRSTTGFLASAPQLAGAAGVTVALVAFAFALPRRHGPASDRPAPRPAQVGVVAFVTSSAFVARPESWLGVALGIVLLAAMAVLISHWSRRAGWATAQRLALAGGALLTYGWVAFVLLPMAGNASTVNLVGQAALVVAAITLLVLTSRRIVACASVECPSRSHGLPEGTAEAGPAPRPGPPPATGTASGG